jgi:hypothetical protein
VLKIKYIVFKRLGKTDLDVLQNAEENTGHTYISIGKNKRWLDELANDELAWSAEGQSEYASIQLEPVNSDPDLVAQELSFRIQHGQREGEARFNNQRTHPVVAWSKPVKEDRPDENSAYIVLIRDQEDKYHARFVRSLEHLPTELRVKIEGKTYGAIELRDEGGIILKNPTISRIIEALKTTHNVILYGPPGTGKTWLMKSVQKCFEQGIAPVLFAEDDLNHPFQSAPMQSFPEGRTIKKSLFVTFHQSMSYESFVAGLRPDIDPTSGSIIYKVKKGPFIDLAENAAGQESASLLLIDEINRGNTAEIFGELITVLEVDKRKAADGTQTELTVEVMLPYPPENGPVTQDGIFVMPFHFYTLASMNSVDRSVAPLDSALRRRFQIIEIGPDIELLKLQVQIVKGCLDVGEHDEWNKISFLACKLLEKINRHIAVFRGTDFRLGHAYFWKVFAPETGTVKSRKQALVAAFREKVIPQLKEMFRDQQELLKTILGGEANEKKLFEFDSGADIMVGDLLVEPTGWLHVKDDQTTDEWLEIMQVIAGVGAEGWPQENEQEAEDTEETEGDTEAENSAQENP